ncbi:helix-turn-helix domain-containing protein [Streptomyces sp. NPDC056257]|uniref:helix-turn-helix domain-containing protein n=1 Tax=Streptomyces sp. NPDC056257 TaxID=3345765 RepID=UPI0035DA6045
MLEAVGLTADEEAVYRLLVMNTAASAQDIAARGGFPLGCAEGLLASLADKGLATPTDRQPWQYTASPPDVALLPRLQRNADALDQARTAVTELLDSYRSNLRRRDAGQLIEVITGVGALRQHLRQLQDNARHEMTWFCKSQYVAMPSGSNATEFEALARGVRYRVLYEQAFFDDAGAVNNVVSGIRAGEDARSVPELPLRLAIADRAVAICSLVPGGPSGSPNEPTAALLRDSSLLQALAALFERYWEYAVPLHAEDVPSVARGAREVHDAAPLAKADRRLLSLLVAGVADKAIASQMGLSRRTVQRHIHHLMTLAGAATRMQLAWQAARRGWL